MIIRREQLSAFSAAMRQEFVQRSAQRLKSDFAAHLLRQNVPPDGLEDWVSRGVDAARKYGVVRDGDVSLYLDCMALLGANFDRDRRWPWAGQILNRTDLDGEAKMDRIHDRLLFEPGVPR